MALQPPLTPFPKIILSPLWINNLSQIEVEIKYLISIYSPDFSKEQNVGLFRDEDSTHVGKLKFYEFSGSVLGVNREVDINRIM